MTDKLFYELLNNRTFNLIGDRPLRTITQEELKQGFLTYNGGNEPESINTAPLNINALEIGIEIEGEEVIDPDCYEETEPEGEYVEEIYTEDTDETFYRCENCGCYYGSWSSAAYCCESCQREIDPSDLYISQTICEKYGLSVDEWETAHDGSLDENGAELRTTGKYPLSYFDRLLNCGHALMCDFAEEAGWACPSYSSNCGLHIHITHSKHNLNSKLNKYLINYLWNIITSDIYYNDTIQLLQRRGTQYARQGTNANGGGRYHQLNFNGRTLEIRLFDASILTNPKLIKIAKSLIVCLFHNLNILREIYIKGKSQNRLLFPFFSFKQDGNKYQEYYNIYKDFLKCDKNILVFLNDYQKIETLLELHQYCYNVYYNFRINDGIPYKIRQNIQDNIPYTPAQLKAAAQALKPSY